MPEAAPRWRKVARDLWRHKARTALVVLAIVVGIVGAGAVLDTWSLLRGVTRSEFRQSRPASATLRTSGVDAALLACARGVPGVADAEARRTVMASAQVEGGWRTAVLYARDDFRGSDIGVVAPEDGAWPPGDGAIVVERSSVDFAKTGIGSTLTVQVGGGEAVALPVTGIARDVGLAPGWMEHVVYAFVTPATLARLGAPSSMDELQLVVAGAGDRDDVRRVAYRVKSAVEAAGHPVSRVEVPVPGRHVHAGQIDSLLFTQGAFGLLALLLSGLLVVNLVSAMLAGQVREIGVMKAIGARAPQLAGMYLGLALVLGLVACAVGIPIAALIGRAYAQFTADLLNFSLAGAHVPPWVLLAELGVGTLLPVAAAAVPVVRGSRRTVAEALRDFGISAGAADAGGGRLLARVGGLGRPILLSLRNAFRRRQRMALTLLTLATGGAVYLGAINLRASIVASVDLLFAPQRYDLGLRLARPYPPERLERLARGVPGVAAAEAWSGARASRQHDDGTLGEAFPIVAAPASSRLLALDLARGRLPGATDGAGARLSLVVNRRLVADEPSLDLGATTTLVIEGRPTPARVVGVVDSGPSPSAYATREAVAALVAGGNATSLVVSSSAKGPALERDLLQRLRSTLADDGVEVSSGSLMREQRRVVEDHLLMVAGFLGIMGQLMIVVGGLGLASTMSLAVLERTREIGVLRALGARHRAILAMIQVEALVIGTASWLVAIPLSVPMSVALGKAFGRIMIRVPVVLAPSPEGMLRWLAVVVVVSLVAAAWPAWRATRVPTAAALAYE
jgi:putative ABC transport system permease protein